MAPRWRGQPGRLEVWYTTLSDPATSTGCWIHHELVAPDHGAPYVHGWAALFGTEGEPVLERFGPAEAEATVATGDSPGRGWPSTPDAVFDPPALRGGAGRLGWDLRWDEATPEPTALYTFPAWAWEREALPAAQVVPVPSAVFSGTLSLDGEVLSLSEQSRGNVAHIYGQGSAKRWGWLHADLGGGDVLEIVSAVSRHRGLDHLPPLAFVQLRTGGRDWPRDPVMAASLFRTNLSLPTWQVRGTVGRWRLRAEITVPEHDSVAVGYVDPDGATATCTNSARADAEVVLERRRVRWETVAAWTLRGTAHAEVGTRP